MTDLTKNFEQLGVNDLVEVCNAKRIKVTKADNRDTLLKKLEKPDKPDNGSE